MILIPIVTILDKFYGSDSPSKFEEIYSSLIKGLRVQLNFVGITDHGWIHLNLFGEDEIIALNLLDREIARGYCSGLGVYVKSRLFGLCG